MMDLDDRHRLTVGKRKGSRLSAVEFSYLAWMGMFLNDVSQPCMDAILEELHRRFGLILRRHGLGHLLLPLPRRRPGEPIGCGGRGGDAPGDGI